MENINRRKMVITGATSTLGQHAVKVFTSSYDLILTDIDMKKLEKIRKQFAPSAHIIKMDITSTVDLAKFATYLRKVDGFDVMLHFARIGPQNMDLSAIYRVNLIGTRSLFDFAFPHIREKGVIVNISASKNYFTPIDQDTQNILADPFNKHFFDNILPLTANSKVAYWWSKYACACLCKHDAPKWQVKQARIVSLFPEIIDLLPKDSNYECLTPFDTALNADDALTCINKMLELLRYIICNESKHVSGVNIALDVDNTLSYFND